MQQLLSLAPNTPKVLPVYVSNQAMLTDFIQCIEKY
jgi:hypothetical protein